EADPKLGFPLLVDSRQAVRVQIAARPVPIGGRTAKLGYVTRGGSRLEVSGLKRSIAIESTAPDIDHTLAGPRERIRSDNRGAFKPERGGLNDRAVGYRAR